MKILFISDFIPPRHIGGPGNRVFEMARELKRLGNEVCFITSCQEKELEGEDTREGIKVFSVYSKYPVFLRHYASVYNPLVVKKIERIIKSIAPDVAHADTIHTHLSYASLKVAKKYSKAVFLASRDVMFFNYGKFFPKERECGEINYKVSWLDNLKNARKRYNPFRNILIKYYLKYVDKIFCVSQELAKALKQNGISNVEVVHNGLPVDDTKPEFFSSYSSKTILLAGRLNEAKGVYALLDSFPFVASEVPESKIVMVGVPDEEKKRIDKYIKDKKIDSGRVKVLGWTEKKEMKPIFESAAVVVSPSLCFDSFPGVNLEAALYKKPVVTTCFGGAKEFIVDGETGYVVNPYDRNALGSKIIELLKDENKARLLGENSFKRLKEKFSISKQAETLLNWYKKYL